MGSVYTRYRSFFLCIYRFPSLSSGGKCSDNAPGLGTHDLKVGQDVPFLHENASGIFILHACVLMRIM